MLTIRDIAEKGPRAEEFLSSRGMSFYLNLREATEFMYGSYSFANAQKLAAQIGPYSLADPLVKKVSKLGLRLEPNGVVPFASPKDFLNSNWLERSNQKTFTVCEIKKIFADQERTPTTIYLSPNSILNIQSFIRVAKKALAVWDQIEMIDALEAHSNPALYLE